MGPFSKADVHVRYLGHDLFKKPEKKTEKALASSFISNCNFQVRTGRNEIVLMLYKELYSRGYKLDLYGKCFDRLNKKLENNQGYDRDKLKQITMRKYRFNLSFENNPDDGYLSEKFWQALQEGTIPIIIKTEHSGKYSPTKNSVLEVYLDKKSVIELADKMIQLSTNETAYEELLNYKYLTIDQFQETHLIWGSTIGYDLLCNLCARIGDSLDPQDDIEPMINNEKVIKIRRIFDFYYQNITLPNTLEELKLKIQNVYNLNQKQRILRMYPSKWKYQGDIWFHQEFNLDTDQKVRDLPHGFQLEFIYLNYNKKT